MPRTVPWPRVTQAVGRLTAAGGTVLKYSAEVIGRTSPVLWSRVGQRLGESGALGDG
jgi:hypothetical protein